MEEQWRPILKFPNYEVSNLGNFRNAKTHRLLTIHQNIKTGRRFICPSINGKQTTVVTTPLVVAAWIGPRPEGLQIDHIDGNKANERIDNLEYVTQQENIQRSFRNGQHGEYPYNQGSHRFLTEVDYAEVKAMWKAGLSQVKIGKKLGINNATVSKILSGKIQPRAFKWRDHGYSREEKREFLLRKIADVLLRPLSEPPMSRNAIARMLNIAPYTVAMYIKEIHKNTEQEKS